jgi:dTDP-L-rhamnose 4-epimerase
MAERVLITGGAGFIGSHLADALLERGHAVRVIDNLCAQVHGPHVKEPEFLSSEAEFIHGDVRDRDAMRRALEGIDVVFHEAAAVGVGQSMYAVREYADVNAVGTATLLDILANEKHSLRKIIVASSMSIYGEVAHRHPDGREIHPPLRGRAQMESRRWEVLDPDDGAPLEPVPTRETKPLAPNSVYAITKRDQEELVLTVAPAYGVDAVALRQFNAFGPRQALSNPYNGVMAIFSARLLNGRSPIIFEDGGQMRDFVHVRDVAHANVLAMERDTGPSSVFNVGSGRFLSIRQVAEHLAGRLGLAISPEINGQFRIGDVRCCVADTAAAKTRLGFEAETPWEEGLDDLIAWVREQTAEDHVEEAVDELRRRGLAT